MTEGGRLPGRLGPRPATPPPQGPVALPCSPAAPVAGPDAARHPGTRPGPSARGFSSARRAVGSTTIRSCRVRRVGAQGRLSWASGLTGSLLRRSRRFDSRSPVRTCDLASNRRPLGKGCAAPTVPPFDGLARICRDPRACVGVAGGSALTPRSPRAWRPAGRRTQLGLPRCPRRQHPREKGLWRPRPPGECRHAELFPATFPEQARSAHGEGDLCDVDGGRGGVALTHAGPHTRTVYSPGSSVRSIANGPIPRSRRPGVYPRRRSRRPRPARVQQRSPRRLSRSR
ncbi:hypothetical protein M0813_15140 [Anaeramoeba flamelloides]|uniref:Uncharacterized protein n=1 Tax=Anaeramoeba flamelloides TaxID=1746091 RepID=A0ABQ8Z341_9EUKA|nr:hypothetical protein M0813_15140 [Anaeramoeba flamelloides]